MAEPHVTHDQPASSTTVGQIARYVGGEPTGETELELHGVEEIDAAGPGQLTFIGDAQYADRWARSRASAALINRDVALEPGDGRALVRVANADLAMAKALDLFAPPRPVPAVGVHPSATVDSSAKLGENVRIGPNCVVGPHVEIGAGTVLQANVTVMDRTVIGADCMLWPGVVIRERCRVGDRCELHLNVGLGGDGFGYRPDESGHVLVKIPQIGTVELGNDVELGAGTCIDRGKFSATVVGEGTKIDNLVQVGHNCRIGRAVVIAGSTGIAGSVTIGDAAVIGGMVAIKDHVRIGARVTLTGCAQVMTDVPDGETWGGSPAMPYREAVRQIQTLRRLPSLVRELKGR